MENKFNRLKNILEVENNVLVSEHKIISDKLSALEDKVRIVKTTLFSYENKYRANVRSSGKNLNMSELRLLSVNIDALQKKLESLLLDKESLVIEHEGIIKKMRNKNDQVVKCEERSTNFMCEEEIEMIKSSQQFADDLWNAKNRKE